jgi:hypothetical protein
MRSHPASVALRCILAAGVVAPAPGCTRWSVQQLPAAQIVEQQRPARIQLRRSSGERTELARPWVEGDSIAGLRRRDTSRVAISDVQAAAVRRFGAVQTLGVTAITVGAVFGLACAMACGWGTIGLGY